MNNWLPRLLQTSDAFFPTGSYAHSFGLEGMVGRGLVSDPSSLRQFLDHTVLPNLEHMELPFVFHAHRAAEQGELDKICELDQQCTAMKTACELRRASSSIGSQRLQILLQIAPHPLLVSLDTFRQQSVIQAHSPIIFGVQTALNRTPIDAALGAYFYQSLVAILSASTKLIRIGQIGCQNLLTHCLEQASDRISNAKLISEEEIGWFSLNLDIASATHETAYSRIFIS